jgi:hypothetical protein
MIELVFRTAIDPHLASIILVLLLTKDASKEKGT